MKVLPGDVVSYKADNGVTCFLTVHSVINDEVVGTEILITNQDEFTDGKTVTIRASQVDAIR